MISREERLRLFQSHSRIELSAEEWATQWPWVDNIWKVTERKKKVWKLKCRLHRQQPSKRKVGIVKSSSCGAEATVEFKDGCVIIDIHQQHEHSVGFCDLMKSNSMVLKWIKDEAKRGHDVNAISSWMKRKMVLYDFVGLKHVTSAYIRSAVKKNDTLNSGPLDTTRNTVEYFNSKGFSVLHKRLECGRIIAFVNLCQIEMLKSIGNGLVVMDATEKTNSSGYNLVSVVAGTNERLWVPILQFWISSENSLLYSECFRWVLLLTENSWKPKAFVIDGS